MKKKYSVIICAFLVGIISTFIYFYNKPEEPTVIRNLPSYVIDVNSYQELASFYDYIFVGRVDEFTGTEYKREKDPYSNFTISPLLNIKGELELGTNISYQKNCGVTKDGKHFVFLDNDIMPEVGKIYLFVTLTVDEGKTLCSSGDNSTIILEDNISEKNIKDSKIVKKMINACKNPKQLLIKRNRIKSIYDKSDNIKVNIKDNKDNIKLSSKDLSILNSNKVLKEDFEYLRSLAGYYTYFFVGRVTEDLGIKYEEHKYENGDIAYSQPYSNYIVTPIYGIDDTPSRYAYNTFVENAKIPFTHYSGLSMLDGIIEVDKSVCFPEVGKLYLFVCSSTSDKLELYSYSNYAVVPLEENITEDNIQESDIVKTFTKAKQKLIKPEEHIQHIPSYFTLAGYSDYLIYKEAHGINDENKSDVSSSVDSK